MKTAIIFTSEGLERQTPVRPDLPDVIAQRRVILHVVKQPGPGAGIPVAALRSQTFVARKRDELALPAAEVEHRTLARSAAHLIEDESVIKRHGVQCAINGG